MEPKHLFNGSKRPTKWTPRLLAEGPRRKMEAAWKHHQTVNRQGRGHQHGHRQRPGPSRPPRRSGRRPGQRARGQGVRSLLPRLQRLETRPGATPHHPGQSRGDPRQGPGRELDGRQDRIGNSPPGHAHEHGHQRRHGKRRRAATPSWRRPSPAPPVPSRILIRQSLAAGSGGPRQERRPPPRHHAQGPDRPHGPAHGFTGRYIEAGPGDRRHHPRVPRPLVSRSPAVRQGRGQHDQPAGHHEQPRSEVPLSGLLGHRSVVAGGFLHPQR